MTGTCRKARLTASKRLTVTSTRYRSPIDHLTVTDEFAREILGHIQRQPNRRVRSLFDFAIGAFATHFGLYPAWAHGIDSHRPSQLRSEDSSDGVERRFGNAVGRITSFHARERAEAAGKVDDPSGAGAFEQ